MARIPYGHVPHFARDDAVVTQLVASDDFLSACDALLAQPRESPVFAAVLEVLVRRLAHNRAALLPHRAVAPQLRSTVKDPWCTLTPALDEAAFIAELPPAATLSVRIDPTLDLSVVGDGRLGRPELGSSDLSYRFGRVVTATVNGPQERLALLARITANMRGFLAEDVAHVVLPKDMPALFSQMDARAVEIDRLLEEGRQLVERAERLVCRLYEASPEMEDEVVASAVARAAARQPEPDE